MVDADGANTRQITLGVTNDLEPVWSPDGSQIAFASDRTGAMSVFVMDADGANAVATGQQGIPSDWALIE